MNNNLILFDTEQEAGKYWNFAKDFSKSKEGTFLRKVANAYTTHMRGKTILLDKNLAERIPGVACMLKVSEAIETATCYIVKKAQIIKGYNAVVGADVPMSERECTYGIPGTHKIFNVEDKYGLKYVIRTYRMYQMGEFCKPTEKDCGHIYFDSYLFDGRDFYPVEDPIYRISFEEDPEDYSSWYYKKLEEI